MNSPKKKRKIEPEQQETVEYESLAAAVTSVTNQLETSSPQYPDNVTEVTRDDLTVPSL